MMNLKESKALLATIRLALANAALHGGASSDRGLGMRYAAWDIANEVWYTLINPSANLAKHYPDRDAWFVACGFRSGGVQ